MSVEQDATSLSHAQNKLSALFDDMEKSAPAEPEAEEAPEPEVEREAPEPSDDYEDDPEPEEKPEPPAKPKYKVKVQGDEEEVDLDELINGYQRQADYQRKTQELAKQRKEIEDARGKIPEDVQGELARLQQLLAEQVAADDKTDWNGLLEKDPIEYLKRQRAAEERRKAHAEMQAKWHAEQQKQHQEVLSRETEQLLAKFPEWKDDNAALAGKKQIAKYLQAEGFNPAELNGIVDHRLLVVAEKARKYDELQKAGKEAVNKVEKLPPKVERPGGSDVRNNPSRDSMARLRKSGSMDDAQAAIKSLLG